MTLTAPASVGENGVPGLPGGHRARSAVHSRDRASGAERGPSPGDRGRHGLFGWLVVFLWVFFALLPPALPACQPAALGAALLAATTDDPLILPDARTDRLIERSMPGPGGGDTPLPVAAAAVHPPLQLRSHPAVRGSVARRQSAGLRPAPRGPPAA
ncbi:hypothetical protein RC1_3904 [Rhodospirillum centenum SW]|uniref:Uncharacterized protein n=1 Tax=Rhodospirillum centenum (strain ATCC 51521 / SW) TaxID=414684 RepID=B6IY73_RHOCS|nr:hypothetical protein RC1_3904 [Rhodospirillum centenum SW]